jgi:hypothetical protein
MVLRWQTKMQIISEITTNSFSWKCLSRYKKPRKSSHLDFFTPGQKWGFPNFILYRLRDLVENVENGDNELLVKDPLCVTNDGVDTI